MPVGIAESLNAEVGAVAKKNSDKVPYCVPNELVCGGIAQVLGLPMPPCGLMVASGSNETYFASLDFNLQGVSLPPVDAEECVKVLLREATGLLLFDILIANSDRHDGNFSVDTASKPAAMNIFDHSHALFGAERGKAIERFGDLETRLGITGGTVSGYNRHCLLDVLADDTHFAEWFERIGALPSYVIEDRCEACSGLGVTTEEIDKAKEFLLKRKVILPDYCMTTSFRLGPFGGTLCLCR